MTTTPNPNIWLEKMAQNSRQAARYLMVAGGVLLIVPLYVGIKYRADLMWVSLSTGCLAAVPIGLGLWYYLREHSGRFSELDVARMLVLAVGGLSGLMLVFVSAALTYHWWEFVAGGMKMLQGKEGWRLWAVLIVFLVGLASMFISLQLGRSEERTNPTLRRLVYGYNVVLTGVLVLAILVVINVLAHSHLSTPYDWTSQSIYSLSSRSESILENLSKPTKVIVIMSQNNEDIRRVRALLSNCRAVNAKIDVEYLSPDADLVKVKKLSEDYKISDREGVLVIYGAPPQEEYQFVSARSLHSGSGGSFSRNRENRFFKGESELMTAISFLSEGKKKPVIYFTQGNGELDLIDSTTMNAPNVGAGVLKRRLDADNYTVKGLRFTKLEGSAATNPDIVADTKVPDDAAIVVVAGPTRPMPKHALDALRNYMEPTGKEAKEKGKLIAMMTVALTEDKDRLVKTGLEELLDTYNVEVGNDRVLCYDSTPMLLRSYTNMDQSFRERNPLAAVFYGKVFRFYDTRSVNVKTAAQPAGAKYRTDPLLFVPVDDDIWAETDFRTPLEQLFLPERRADIQKKLSTKPLTIGAVVTESDAPNPMSPTPTDEKPRMIVLGCPTSASNAGIQSARVFGRQYDLFQSMIGWLRERPASIGIEAKKQDVYELNAANISLWRLLGLPVLLMLVTVIGLGAGVWVVRRR